MTTPHLVRSSTHPSSSNTHRRQTVTVASHNASQSVVSTVVDRIAYRYHRVYHDVPTDVEAVPHTPLPYEHAIITNKSRDDTSNRMSAYENIKSE